MSTDDTARNRRAILQDATASFLGESTSTAAASTGNRPLKRRVTIRHGEGMDPNLMKYQLEEEKMFKVVIDGDDGGVAMRQVFERVDAAIGLRTKYKHEIEMRSNMISRISPKAHVSVVNGIYQVADHQVSSFYAVQPWSVFATDVEQLRLTVGHSLCNRACAHRLDIMQERSRMFFLLNSDIEEKQNYRKAGGVFSKATKVDNSIKSSRAHNPQELLDFVVSCFHRYPDEGISISHGTGLVATQDDVVTLRDVFARANVDVQSLTVESLHWQARWRGSETGEVFIEKDALGYAIRKIFLSFEGAMCARLLKKYFSKMESTKYPQATELAIPIYGHRKNELLDVANFLHRNEIGPHHRNMWILQLRFLDAVPAGETVDARTVQDQLDYIFLPLIKATLQPDEPRNGALVWLMPQIGALQIESTSTEPSADFDKKAPFPNGMSYGSKPNELYFFYYVNANLNVLNSLRKRKGMNTLQLRTSAGGNGHSGNLESLMGGFFFCDVITRASRLTSFPVLQYLLGIHGVGLTVSPLCDSADGLPYGEHPLPNLLHRCLHVSISTEQPMQYHQSTNPLVEEYGSAQKLFRLTALDVAEMARNSVHMSSFPYATKCDWLGESFARGVLGNQFEHSQVTNVRLSFREESWNLEREMIRELFRLAGPDAATRRATSVALQADQMGLNRWHFLSNVKDVEYNTVMDSRIRFPRTVINGPHKEVASALAAAPLIARACQLRRKYQAERPKPWEAKRRTNVEADFQRKTATFNEDDWTYAGSDAVFISFPKNALHAWPRHLPTLEDYHRDLLELKSICENPVVRDFCHRRLETLEHKYRLHLALNHANEAGMTEKKASSNRDIYQACKVDTHIHMAAGMTPRQMLHFVKRKLQNNADDIAMKKGATILTLGSLLKSCGITKNLTVDQLNVQADHSLFERFDNFNNKYNPMENPDLRTLLLKTDNFMNGRYFAELIHDVFEQYSKDRSTFAENRISIYGMNLKEWDKLSSWFATHGMSSKHNKWIIQVPRVYKVFRAMNVIGSFGQYLQNIFEPLWEASLHPSEHPTLHYFLNHMSGFDSVDNEATIDLPFVTISPWAWTSVENPPYNYYLYYLYANIRMLNEFRASRGFSTFDMRPHCGESGSDEHLLGAYLCADGIGHGINLKNDPSLQYLYYLAQIGLHVSPLSNNALFLYFLNNPFPEFFRRGLNVSLSTDDPMMFHQTQEPLIEEYSIAARVWGFSQNDLCEIARNSVLQSGFEHEFKRDAIGDRWYMSSSLGNDPNRTHLSDIRVAFRFETYHTEIDFLELCCGKAIPRSMLSSHQEQEINEQNQGTESEQIILSTHDQTMEVTLRDMDAKREQIRIAKIQIDALRRQQRSLVDNLTEVGIRRQTEREEEERHSTQKGRFQYHRRNHMRDSRSEFRTLDSLTATRLLGKGRPLPDDFFHHTSEDQFKRTGGRQVPTPPPRDD